MSSIPTDKIPRVGQIVHYVSYGTPAGEYPSTCRAAIVTAVGPDTTPGGMSADDVSLAVLNPTGLFFNQSCPHDESGRRGGTWHWPEPA